MKILLTILCAIMVLFAGGCAAVLFLSSGGMGMIFTGGAFALIPGAVAALNVAVIAALWGRAKVGPPVYMTLVVLDGIVVVLVLLGWLSAGLGDGAINVFSTLLAGGFGLKGYLTYRVSKSPGGA